MVLTHCVCSTLWDTWGLNQGAYQSHELDLIVQGLLPDGWTIDSDCANYAMYVPLLTSVPFFTSVSVAGN